jgi:hypothetical protein
MIRAALVDDRPTSFGNEHKNVLNGEPFRFRFPVHIRGTPAPIWCRNNTFISLLHISAFECILRRYKKVVTAFCERSFPGIPAAVATAELIAAMNRIKAMPELQLVNGPAIAAIPVPAPVGGDDSVGIGGGADDALGQLAAVALALDAAAPPGVLAGAGALPPGKSIGARVAFAVNEFAAAAADMIPAIPGVMTT